MGQKPYAKEPDEVLQSSLSGSGRYVEYGAVAGARRPQPSDLTSKKMSPDGSSTCKQYDALLSILTEMTIWPGCLDKPFADNRYATYQLSDSLCRWDSDNRCSLGEILYAFILLKRVR